MTDEEMTQLAINTSRTLSGLVTLRPCDANEVIEAYRYLMQLRHEPGCAGTITAAPANA